MRQIRKRREPEKRKGEERTVSTGVKKREEGMGKVSHFPVLHCPGAAMGWKSPGPMDTATKS